MKKKYEVPAIVLGLALGLAAQQSYAVLNPQNYVNNGDGTWTLPVNTGAATGSITFNDWGYTGPMGSSVNDFIVNGGYDGSRLAQIQSVQTVAPDYITPDPTSDLWTDKFGGNTQMLGANMDGSVNFYRWGYTTPTSSFNNMRIDKAGNYAVAKEDMQFGFYDSFEYNNNVDPISTWDTAINFQPYAISDGIGWCGSTMISNPNGLESMAGQIAFDFAFDAYLFDGVPGGPNAPQLVNGFVMRSYGDYYVDVTHTPTGRQMLYEGSAVGNNTDPASVVPGVGGTLDANYFNKVSFLGAGVVPDGVWVTAGSYEADGITPILNPDGTWAVTIVAEGTPGAIYHSNDFAGYAFLLRADADRTLEWISPGGHSDYVATDPAAYASIGQVVPIPAAIWLFGSGLIGLIGLARRGKNCS